MPATVVAVQMSTSTPIPTPTPALYVCAPGGGQSGSCEVYADPERSECPKVYTNNPTCNNECSDPHNRCKNSSGKFHSFWEWLLWLLALLFG